jgi:DNA-binding transcriptional ArsR family regulator
MATAPCSTCSAATCRGSPCSCRAAPNDPDRASPSRVLGYRTRPLAGPRLQQCPSRAGMPSRPRASVDLFRSGGQAGVNGRSTMVSPLPGGWSYGSAANDARNSESLVATSNADVCTAIFGLLHALTPAQRLAIVDALDLGPRRRRDLVALLGVHPRRADHHLAIRHAAGLVQPVRRGREVVYSLRCAHVARVVAGAIAFGQRSA